MEIREFGIDCQPLQVIGPRIRHPAENLATLCNIGTYFVKGLDVRAFASCGGTFLRKIQFAQVCSRMFTISYFRAMEFFSRKWADLHGFPRLFWEKEVARDADPKLDSDSKFANSECKVQCRIHRVDELSATNRRKRIARDAQRGATLTRPNRGFIVSEFSSH